VERIQLLIIQLLEPLDGFVTIDKFDVLIRILREFDDVPAVPADLICADIASGEQLDEVVVAEHLARIV